MRKYFRPAAIAFILSLFLSGYSNTQAIDVPLNATVHVYSSPKGDATEAIVSDIDNTKSEMLIHSYSFANREIAKHWLMHIREAFMLKEYSINQPGQHDIAQETF